MHEEATVYVKELGIFLTMKVFENTPAVLSLGKLCDENGYSCEWINGQNPHLIKNGIWMDTLQYGELRSYCGTRLIKFVLWIFIERHLRNRRVILHHLLHPHLLHLQKVRFRFEKGKMGLTVTSLQCKCLVWLMMDQGNLRKSKPTKTKKTNKKKTTKERGNSLDSEIPERLQEFRENLVDDEIPLQGGSHASSSHEVSLEPTFKRREDLGKHSVYTHFPKDRNCEICIRTKNHKGPMQKTQWRSRTSC